MIYLISFAIIILVTLLYKAYTNTKKVMINTISHGEGNNEPALHVLQISDMHLENISISPESLYQMLKSKKIDLIALTGDFLDRKRTIPKLIPYLEMFNRLTPKGKTLNIIGIDDASTSRSDLKKSYQNLKEGYNLVLTHDPNIVLNMKNYNFDYLLSGHFHGGQIHWPKPYHLAKLGRKMVKLNMVKGLHYYDEKPFYISEGLGQTGVNIRVGSRPEITLHTLAMNVLNGSEITPAAI